MTEINPAAFEKLNTFVVEVITIEELGPYNRKEFEYKSRWKEPAKVLSAVVRHWLFNEGYKYGWSYDQVIIRVGVKNPYETGSVRFGCWTKDAYDKLIEGTLEVMPN